MKIHIAPIYRIFFVSHFVVELMFWNHDTRKEEKQKGETDRRPEVEARQFANTKKAARKWTAFKNAPEDLYLVAVVLSARGSYGFAWNFFTASCALS